MWKLAFLGIWFTVLVDPLSAQAEEFIIAATQE
jgi:hypothetical protein